MSDLASLIGEVTGICDDPALSLLEKTRELERFFLRQTYRAATAEVRCSILEFTLSILKLIRTTIKDNGEVEFCRFLDHKSLQNIPSLSESLDAESLQQLLLSPLPFPVPVDDRLQNLDVPGLKLYDNSSRSNVLRDHIVRMINSLSQLGTTKISKSGRIPHFHPLIQSTMLLCFQYLGVQIDIKSQQQEKQESGAKLFPDIAVCLGDIPIYREEDNGTGSDESLDAAIHLLTSSCAENQQFPILACSFIGDYVQFYLHKKVEQVDSIMAADDESPDDSEMSPIRPLPPGKPITKDGSLTPVMGYIELDATERLHLFRCIVNWCLYVRFYLIPLLASSTDGCQFKKNPISNNTVLTKQIIKISRDVVEKTLVFQQPDLNYNLEAIGQLYEILKDSTADYVLKVKAFECGENFCWVKMEKLECSGYPLNAEEFFMAGVSVLKSVVLLHSNRICHCDLRWLNVRSDMKRTRFVLMDFECCHRQGDTKFKLAPWGAMVQLDDKGYQPQHDLILLKEMLFTVIHLVPLTLVLGIDGGLIDKEKGLRWCIDSSVTVEELLGVLAAYATKFREMVRR